MDNRKILVAYGTRYGSTEEISQEIAKILEQKGIETKLHNLGTGKYKNWPKLDDFDGVIIGTSLKVNKWKKQVKLFLENNKMALEGKKIGAFTCGLYAIAEPDEAKKDISKRLIEKFELEAELYEAFGGILDFSEDANIGRTGRAVLQLAAKGMSAEKGLKFDMNGCNDFRDWDKIRGFAKEFINIL